MTGANNPVQPIEFGKAVQLSLDNYYDLLKAQVGGLGSNEFLQLKLVADTVDIGPKPVDQLGYRWFSYYNLLRRADVEIEPSPVTGQVSTGAEELSSVYGEFLSLLRTFATMRDLTQQEQLDVADLSLKIRTLRDEAEEMAILDRQRWIRYATLQGINVASNTLYLAWSNSYGYYQDIQTKLQNATTFEATRQRILDRTYTDAADRKIVEAEAQYINPFQRLRYPTMEDREYDDGGQFSATYLSRMPLGSTGLFDDRRVISYDKTLDVLKTGTGGAFSATFNRSTVKSTSISTDWNAGGGASYAFFSARASSSEHTKIQDDFRTGTTLDLSAKSVYKANLIYPDWFDATLFAHKRVKENIRAFEDFFGPRGRLRYYPLSLVIVRGFSVLFNNSQNWSYDYERTFSASAGGGFNVCGIGFGASGSYSRNETEHQVDQATTKLTITDGDETLRFVGITVKENTVWDSAMDVAVKKAFPKGVE